MNEKVDIPIVSVVMITYLHEAYIEEAINGVLMQKCDFPVEFIIADDCSPDNTKSIVERLIQGNKNGHWIKYTRHEKNLGMMTNFYWALLQAKGEFIALCEGDDYWIDSLKLQKQVDFLKKNQDCVLCFADRNILKDSGMEHPEFLYNSECFDKSQTPFIHIPTLTIVFRNLIQKMPDFLQNNLIDASLFLFLSQYGNFYYFREKVAVYRVQNNGVFSGSSELKNIRRSVRVRLACWKGLNKINKKTLAQVLIHWIGMKKRIEKRNYKYLSYLKSWIMEKYFKIYLFLKVSGK